jgi:hypothetical protein
VDAVRGDGGQSLVVAALLLGVAAVAVMTVQGAQDRLVSGLRDQRAGEAAVAAAGAALADLQLARVRALGRGLDPAETARFVADDDVVAAVRAAATAMTGAHGTSAPSDIAILSFGVEIEVHVTVAGRRHIALIEPPL